MGVDFNASICLQVDLNKIGLDNYLENNKLNDWSELVYSDKWKEKYTKLDIRDDYYGYFDFVYLELTYAYGERCELNLDKIASTVNEDKKLLVSCVKDIFNIDIEQDNVKLVLDTYNT